MSVPVCVIVGAGPGNGAAFARQLSRAGYRVALLARSRDVLDTLVAEIAGTRAMTLNCRTLSQERRTKLCSDPARRQKRRAEDRVSR
jgi:short-subunit dehydrogenase